VLICCGSIIDRRHVAEMKGMLTYFVVLSFRFAPFFSPFQFIYASFGDADSGLDFSLYFRMVELLVSELERI
jgi:hypothetical protein